MWWLTMAAALSAPVEVPLPPQKAITLPVKAEVLTVKGTVVGDDCPGAVQTAFDKAPIGATILEVLVRKDPDGKSTTDCQQRVAGPSVSSSRVTFDIVVLLPGAPASVYPELDADRALQIVKLLTVLGEGSPANVPIDDIEGSAWVRLPRRSVPRVLNPTQLDRNARATRAFRGFVADRARNLAPLLDGMPEVDGAVVEVDVESEDPNVGRKSHQSEVFRFIVPTPAFRRYATGQLTADQFLSEMRVEHAPDAKKRRFERIGVDVIQGELAVEGAPPPKKRDAREAPDVDLSGVRDE
ncbi:MAG: hypothetical protein AAF602_25360 [Myxococcota bacterium]